MVKDEYANAFKFSRNSLGDCILRINGAISFYDW